MRFEKWHAAVPCARRADVWRGTGLDLRLLPASLPRYHLPLRCLRTARATTAFGSVTYAAYLLMEDCMRVWFGWTVRVLPVISCVSTPMLCAFSAHLPPTVFGALLACIHHCMGMVRQLQDLGGDAKQQLPTSYLWHASLWNK